MKYNFEGQMVELPEWCKDWSEEEKRNAAYAIANCHEWTIEEIEAAEEERRANMIDEDELIDELRKAGFTNTEIEEICVYYYSGYTLDNAIQTVVCI